MPFFKTTGAFPGNLTQISFILRNTAAIQSFVAPWTCLAHSSITLIG